eukprot:CAMPEP_0170172184 /NCGR_PEP_ID=MMETSP0040_2-20121228/5419_1 /TAXON_ID=641309 /ORGANISM="Lotharella oceanica, Strain CCMP622" /LENGTH=234 /DNA_ID=CAMNT_0010412721 /DNA_START=217 /DNA_END=921 /DNA_ORIENTATION=-
MAFHMKILDETIRMNKGGMDVSELAVVDLGGGTGKFSELMYKSWGLKKDVSCVDPSESMLSTAKGPKGVEYICRDALNFAKEAKDKSMDVVVMKEMIHHLDLKEAEATFTELRRGMRSGGQCVVLTRPLDPDYPFFDAAMKVYNENATSAKDIMETFTKSGFKNVSMKVHPLAVHMKKEEWLGMVGKRFWSTFSRAHFSEAELEAGIKEIDKKYAANKDGNLVFEERMLVIQAR